jgi:hypothetical protein
VTVAEDGTATRRALPRWRLLALGLLLLALLLVAALWTQRRQIATEYVNRELARRGVKATYKVTRVGFRTQRMEQLVIGDPRRPDATAEWVEIEISLGVRRPRVELIRARGVRLNGRVVDGKVTLGELDKLLPPPTGKPFRLPNQRVDLADASIRLDTPAGRIGIALEGSGNLAYSFEGRIAAVSRGLRAGDCRVTAPRLVADLRTEEERPTLTGPLRAESAACGGVDLIRPRLTLKATLDAGFDGGEGHADVELARLRSGGHAFDAISGRIGFDGDADGVRGGLDLAAARASVGDYRTARAGLAGRYAVAPKAGTATLVGEVSANQVAGGGALKPIAAALAGAGGTPFEPIGDALAAAVRRVGESFDARGALRFVTGPGFSAARLQRLRAQSRSGALFQLEGETGLTYYWPSGTTRIQGDVALSGGGFPDMRFALDQARPGGAISGAGRIAPMAAGGARLALGEVRFNAAPGGATSLNTIAVMDGPFAGGRVTGLVVPVSGRLDGDGGLVFGERCTPVSFGQLQTGGVDLGPTRLPLCPSGPGLVWRRPGGALMAAAEVRAPRLAGRIGGTPLAVTGDRLRFELAGRTFAGTSVAIGLGQGQANRFDFASLTGRFVRGGAAGDFAGGDAKLANVPLLISEGGGKWSLLGGDLALSGAVRVADEAQPERFYPLVSKDFSLTLKDGRIAANGLLTHPETGTRVTEVAIDHRLATGTGRAVLDVPGITFTEDFQPEALTRLTTGVVALVAGTVTGRGEIAWGPDGTTSTGSFSTRGMNLAATFGPVEGLTTTVNFTDLLGLATAPGQTAQIGVVRTGIDVFDGLIRYQLLPGLRVRVEAGRWPFAGGELLLEETILDFSRPSPKRLTFRVAGLDGAIFVQQMEFSNIAATGIFDGVIPMVFDEGGGRIVAGRMEARPQGGELSYIGELTDRQLGYYGKVAFDALKSMRYQKLNIDLDGSLDGEFLAAIELDGIARNTPRPGGIAGAVFTQLAKIPFEFNIRVRGPFRALLATARSLEDPTLLIQSVLPEILQDRPTTTTDVQPTTTNVQPQESETVQ